MDSNIWKAIPHGKNDPPRLLFDPGRPQSYDFNDPDSQFVMFNRELAGCFTLPFSKPMRTDLPGRAIAARVVPLRLAGYDTWCLGLKLGGVLHGYGREVAVEVSGFTDTDGNVMEPARLRVRTPDTAGHDPRYAAHEKVARQAAQDGIALLKNDRGGCRCPAARMTPIRNHWKPLSETAGYPWGSCSKMCAVWWRDCCGCKKEDFK